MTVEYAGSLTLGQCIPMANTAQAELVASVDVALPDVQARVTGLLAVQLQLATPPSIADLIAAATAIIASLSATVPPVPQLTAVAAALAELQATLGQLNASLAFSADFGSLLGTPGIHYYAFAGRADELGTQMSAQLSAGLPGGAGAGETIAGVVLLANDGGAIAALQAVMGI